ncbi:uncharacterized protein LOC143863979 [Tasmannia lanceolata]|uniref:uncharacterized protein LOC143863979 n=1 Tax=Tasmannia lanceolata TaxID=3420 RepID=UPI004063B70A
MGARRSHRDSGPWGDKDAINNKLKNEKQDFKMMNGRNRLPHFTASQWEELGHQALIFKYMMCEMTVPPVLVYQIKSSLEPQQPLCYFFDECPLNREPTMHLEEEPSNGALFSRTQHSISTPKARLDSSVFNYQTSNRKDD